MKGVDYDVVPCGPTNKPPWLLQEVAGQMPCVPGQDDDDDDDDDDEDDDGDDYGDDDDDDDGERESESESDGWWFWIRQYHELPSSVYYTDLFPC